MVLEKLQEDFTEDRNILRNQHQQLVRMISEFQEIMYRHIKSLELPGKDSAKAVPTLRDVPLVRDCDELYMNGITFSGVYPLRLPSRHILNVWCDMDTAHGGWTVVQRRVDGSVNFTRKWDDYAFGFGNANTEYWLGNENLYYLSHFKNYSIRFDMWDWEGNHVYALYDYFRVESEQMQYRLTIEGYSGTAGDAMSTYHNNMKFSTIDRDYDQWELHCAKKDQSGWWFRACGYASLNGLYIQKGNIDIAPDGLIRGIIWYQWKKTYGYSMKKTEIKIKPLIQVKLDRLKDSLRKDGSENKMPEETTEEEDSTEVSVTEVTAPSTQKEVTAAESTEPTVGSTESMQTSSTTNFYEYDDFEEEYVDDT